MNRFFIIGLAVGTVLAVGQAAIAGPIGTGVMNRNTVRHSSGYGQVNFSSYERSNTHQRSYSESIKVETFGGDVNTSIANYNGSKLTGTAISTNQQVVDPVSIITTSGMNAVTNSYSVNSASGFERYNFTERSNTIEAESYVF